MNSWPWRLDPSPANKIPLGLAEQEKPTADHIMTTV
jgi:hypothetical protein